MPFFSENLQGRERFSLFDDVLNSGHGVILTFMVWFGVDSKQKMPAHYQDREIPRNWEEPNDLKSRSSTKCHLITSPIPSPSSTSVPVA